MSEENCCAVFVPMYKTSLESHEKISLAFLQKNLKGYDKFLVVPESFNEKDCSFDLSSFKIKRFPDKFFTSMREYNRLLYKSSFYKQFTDYEYILSYQLDSLVFKDKLEYFCSLNYDFIGSPFVKNQLKKIKDPKKIKHRNGGFSLRKVDSFIKVAEAYEKKYFKNFWFLKYFLNDFFNNIVDLFKSIFKVFFLRMGDGKSLFTINEDIFWSLEAKNISPEFKVAPFNVAVSFGFENNVSLCFKMNNNSLPFGAHAFQCEKNLREWKKLKKGIEG